MVKCLNIGKNIGKPIYRSISSRDTCMVTTAILMICRISFQGFLPRALYLSQGFMKKYLSFLLNFSCSRCAWDSHQWTALLPLGSFMLKYASLESSMSEKPTQPSDIYIYSLYVLGYSINVLCCYMWLKK